MNDKDLALSSKILQLIKCGYIFHYHVSAVNRSSDASKERDIRVLELDLPWVESARDF